MSRETTTKALHAFKARHGQPAVRKLLSDVAGVDSFGEVPDDLLADVERAAREGLDDGTPAGAMLDENGALNVGAIYAKWNSAAGKHRTES